jgi:uncharacterized protein YndB with AHSA1/START domain
MTEPDVRLRAVIPSPPTVVYAALTDPITWPAMWAAASRWAD